MPGEVYGRASIHEHLIVLESEADERTRWESLDSVLTAVTVITGEGDNPLRASDGQLRLCSNPSAPRDGFARAHDYFPRQLEESTVVIVHEGLHGASAGCADRFDEAAA